MTSLAAEDISTAEAMERTWCEDRDRGREMEQRSRRSEDAREPAAAREDGLSFTVYRGKQPRHCDLRLLASRIVGY